MVAIDLPKVRVLLEYGPVAPPPHSLCHFTSYDHRRIDAKLELSMESILTKISALSDSLTGALKFASSEPAAHVPSAGPQSGSEQETRESTHASDVSPVPCQQAHQEYVETPDSSTHAAVSRNLSKSWQLLQLYALTSSQRRILKGAFAPQ